MLDPRILRNDLCFVAKKLSRKKFFLDVDMLCNKESKRKLLQHEIENLQFKRNSLSKDIGKAKLLGKNIDVLCNFVRKINIQLKIMKHSMQILDNEIQQYVLSVPNIPHDTIPDGINEKDNLEIFSWGKKRNFDFPILDHVKLGKLLNGLNFNSAAKLTGSRFVVMHGIVAQLHRALIQFMLDLHITKHGYQEYYVPYLVNQNSLYGSGQLPKFFSDLFHIQSLNNNDYYTLIPTAEVPLINLFRSEIIDECNLPIKITAHTPCFRSEVGNYGRDTRGLIRMHQFDKVELIQMVTPESSMATLEEITGHAEKVLQLLDLPYRKVLLCAGETGFTASKTYDLEVWFPSQNLYREVSSCSNTEDFQSRRIKSRYRDQTNNKTKLLHILNGSGLAIDRTLAAILENYQQKDGSIQIPLILHNYMHGITNINLFN